MRRFFVGVLGAAAGASWLVPFALHGDIFHGFPPVLAALLVLGFVGMLVALVLLYAFERQRVDPRGRWLAAALTGAVVVGVLFIAVLFGRWESVVGALVLFLLFVLLPVLHLVLGSRLWASGSARFAGCFLALSGAAVLLAWPLTFWGMRVSTAVGDAGLAIGFLALAVGWVAAGLALALERVPRAA
jgi:hypothetical protein